MAEVAMVRFTGVDGNRRHHEGETTLTDRVKIFMVPEGAFSRRRMLAGTGVAAVAAAALAACGSSGGGSEEGSGDATTAPAAEPAPAVTEAEAAPVTEAEAAPDTEPAAPAEGGGKILRVGTLGGANDILDGQHIVAKADIVRQQTGWEPLMSFSPEYVPEYANGIAKDVTANAADDYTITLKDGVKFSNGEAGDRR